MAPRRRNLFGRVVLFGRSLLFGEVADLEARLKDAEDRVTRDHSDNVAVIEYMKGLGIKAITAAEILAHHNEPELWDGLLTHKSPDIRLRTLQYLTDRRDGKPKQAVDVSGGIPHAHMTYRSLAGLSQEHLQALDAITKKIPLLAQDAPQNQIESKPAIESADVAESPCQPHEAP